MRLRPSSTRSAPHRQSHTSSHTRHLAEGTGTDPEAFRLQALSRRCPSPMGLPSMIGGERRSRSSDAVSDRTPFQGVLIPDQFTLQNLECGVERVVSIPNRSHDPTDFEPVPDPVRFTHPILGGELRCRSPSGYPDLPGSNRCRRPLRLTLH